MSGGGGYSGNVSVMSSAILGMDDRSFGQGFGGGTPSALDISNAGVLAANNLSGGHGGMATGAGGMRFQLGLSTSPLPHNFSISPMLGMAGRDLTSPAVGDTSFGLGGMQVFNQSGIGMGMPGGFSAMGVGVVRGRGGPPAGFSAVHGGVGVGSRGDRGGGGGAAPPWMPYAVHSGLDNIPQNSMVPLPPAALSARAAVAPRIPAVKMSRRRDGSVGKKKGGTRWTVVEDNTLRTAVHAHTKACQAEGASQQGYFVPGQSADGAKGGSSIIPHVDAEGRLHGPMKWSLIADQLPGRVGKQCRERWFNHLDPSLKKGKWSDEEDRTMLTMQREIGNKWSEIAKSLPGRSENTIKNRWNSRLRKEAQREKRRIAAGGAPRVAPPAGHAAPRAGPPRHQLISASSALRPAAGISGHSPASAGDGSPPATGTTTSSSSSGSGGGASSSSSSGSAGGGSASASRAGAGRNAKQSSSSAVPLVAASGAGGATYIVHGVPHMNEVRFAVPRLRLLASPSRPPLLTTRSLPCLLCVSAIRCRTRSRLRRTRVVRALFSSRC